MERWKYIQFSAEQTPESIEVFTTPDNQYEAVIGLRGASYLTYMNLDSFEIRKISINANAWDTHVSFTPLYLSLSPDMKYLVMATDKNQHIVLYAGKHLSLTRLIDIQLEYFSSRQRRKSEGSCRWAHCWRLCKTCSSVASQR
jgi:hypothetical protein